jgi:hypothetical protein
MSKKKNYKRKDYIENCPNCFPTIKMERREHINTSIIKTNYYFTEWDYCRNCKLVKLYEKYKVFNIKNTF